MPVKRVFVRVAASLLLVTLCAVPSAAETDSAEGLFERAETLYRQLRVVDPACADPDAWISLASAFERIPVEYPTNPLAGDALWRSGDIHARRHTAGDPAALAQARSSWQQLVAQYPSNAHAPWAYLRLGEAAPANEAATHYYRLLQRFPDTEAAEEARLRLTRGAVADAPAVAPEPPLAQPGSITTTQRESTDAFGDVPQPLDEELEALPTPASGTSFERVDTSPEEPAPVFAAPTDPGEFGRVLSVRHFSDETHTRVVFDLDRPVQHQIGEAESPPRVFIDLIGADLPASLPRDLAVAGAGVRRVRVGLNRPGVVRVVLDLEGPSRYNFFTLADPHRLVLDVPSPEMSERLAHARRPPAPAGGSEARQLGFGVRRIVIDPGHGGTAPGAIGRSGVTEKELALDISRRLAANLRRSNYDVLLTRDDDSSLDLEQRPAFATASQADLFVSVHINSSTNRKLSGFETYYLDLATDPTAAETAARENAMATRGVGALDDVLDEIVKNANKRESRDLAHSIQDSLVLQMSRNTSDVRDLGVKHAPFVVLVGANMPAVLIECAFVSNASEESRLNESEYRQEIADAIHIGIENYVAKRRMITDSR